MSVPASPGDIETPSTPDRLDLPADDPLFRRLFPPLATGVKWGLERTRRALAELGDPHLRYRTIHVGGTNGKGSVASTIHAVLGVGSPGGAADPAQADDPPAEARRLRSGLYTSPHLCSATERFQIGGGPVADDVLVRYADEVRDVVVRGGLTFFEAITVLGFHLFAREGAEVVVAEVGLGGRLDATNVVEPDCCAITNVAMDHADYLGGTLTAIAREKAGIIKPHVPVVTAETDPELLQIFREVAEERDAPLHVVDPPGDIREFEVDANHTAFTVDTRSWGTLRLRTPLVGRHQAVNTALAVAAMDRFPAGLRPTREAVVAGVASVRWPGRDQVEVVDGRTWIFDVAHNTAGVASLVDTLDRLDLPGPRVAVVGVLGDKDWQAMLPPLLERCAATVLTVPPTAPETRRWDPDAVAADLRAALPGEWARNIHVERDFGAALERSRALAGDGTVVVTGSVHTVGSALRSLELIPWGR